MSKPYHHGDLKAALLNGGLAILDSRGVDAVTVRAVAREAGVAHSAPANHFKDRAALLGALAARIFEDLASEVKNALAGVSSQSREDRLHAFADAVIRFALRHPHRYRLLWRRDCLDAVSSGVEAAGTVLYERVRAALAPRAELSTLSIESEIIAAWSLVHGYVSLRIEGALVDGKDELSGKAESAAIVDVLIRGL